jgi:flagellin-like protein
VKGVSPIIATVLLILISIATSLILWNWVSSTVSQTPSELPFLSERVKIEAVSIEGNIVKVYVRNLVNNDVRVGPVYIINGSSGSDISSELK